MFVFSFSYGYINFQENQKSPRIKSAQDCFNLKKKNIKCIK